MAGQSKAYYPATEFVQRIFLFLHARLGQLEYCMTTVFAVHA